MIKTFLWNIKAKLYFYLRNRFPFRYILQHENKSLKQLLSQVPDSQLKFVVDLGVGTGNALSIINCEKIRIGVDFSLSMLHLAKKDISALFVNCDVLFLSLKNEIADLVLAIGLSEYIPQLEIIFQEMKRISKPNAFAIVTYAPKNIWTWLRWFLGHKIYPRKFDDILRIIQSYGFEVVAREKSMMQRQLLIIKSKYLNG